MRHRLLLAILLILGFSPAAALAQVGGNLAALPAVELRLDITTAESGAPQLSQPEFRLKTGDYYRMHVKSDGKTVWRFECPDLLQNSHLRVVTIAGIEVQMQSMVFRAFEFDAAGEAMFSFVPIRPGTYDIYVGQDPRSMGRPTGEAGVHAQGKTAFARVVVE